MRTLAVVCVDTPRAASNIPSAVSGARTRYPGADVLVIDDVSASLGTAGVSAVIDADVLRRPGGQRLAPAPIAGCNIGLAKGYDVIVEVDGAEPGRTRTYSAAQLRSVDLDAVARSGRRWRSSLARALRRS